MEVGATADARLRRIARAAELLGDDSAHGPFQSPAEYRRDLARAAVLAHELVDLCPQLIQGRAVGLDGGVECGLVLLELGFRGLLLGQLGLQLSLEGGQLVLRVGELYLFVWSCCRWAATCPTSCPLADVAISTDVRTSARTACSCLISSARSLSAADKASS